MKKNERRLKTLSEYIDYQQSRGNYIFFRKDAIKTLNISAAGFDVAIYRLKHKKRIIRIRHGFYVIVPLEYVNAGSIPASWFIDDLMRFHKLPYYVGLLSAAALLGATNQQPQEFQVVTNKVLRPIIVGRTRIRFFLKRDISQSFIGKIKTVTGSMNVSSPEMTALDLLAYVNASGQINNVATIITELAKKIDEKKLSKIASEFKLPIVQRLGYLFDTFADIDVTSSLYKWINKKNPKLVPLVPGKSYSSIKKDQKWGVLINEKVEVDI